MIDSLLLSISALVNKMPLSTSLYHVYLYKYMMNVSPFHDNLQPLGVSI